MKCKENHPLYFVKEFKGETYYGNKKLYIFKIFLKLNF